MFAEGNSQVERCALNLLRTVRGEVPYVRTKGIDRSLIDIPSTQRGRFTADAEWVLTNFEPRADIDQIETAGLMDVEALAELN